MRRWTNFCVDFGYINELLFKSTKRFNNSSRAPSISKFCVGVHNRRGVEKEFVSVVGMEERRDVVDSNELRRIRRCEPLGNLSSNSIRAKFVSFFEQHNHVEWKSSPVIPYGDNTLLFINAGMNQFKPLFLKVVDPQSPMASLKRVANSQKCIRAGGKHNDLDDVGKDVYHHTFFEMLGNWSFGDYFKSEAIAMAWTLLVDVYKIDSSRLYATYFGGDAKLPNCPPDEDARDLWLKYLPAERVLPFGCKDNFWEMADTGPCGPCSEIHYDRIGGRDASALVNADDPSVLEIWNLVFMQFTRESDGSLTSLPAPCVDTGMGLERIASVIQGVESNYDTDIFTPIFATIQKELHLSVAYSGKLGNEDVGCVDMSYRIVADHLRCLAIAIADGAEPSNEGRGYVLRRILRRALRYGRQYLGAPADDPWLHKLVDSVCETLGGTYPELIRMSGKIKDVVRQEDLQFARTLQKGVDYFQKCLLRINEAELRVFPGEDAFILYTSYGFPLDLTEIIAKENNLPVDTEEFNRRFKLHQLISENKGFKQSKDCVALGPEQLHYMNKTLQLRATDDSAKYFFASSGQNTKLTSQLLAIWDGNCFLNNAPSAAATIALITNKTNFYAEQGGQAYDTGIIFNQNTHAAFNVQQVQRYGEFIAHIGHVTNGTFQENDEVLLEVDVDRRSAIERNHTATHLMNFALRKTLQGRCEQRGSLVEMDRLRFDFQWNCQMESEQICEVEEYVCNAINADLSVFTDEFDLYESKRIEGIRAVFGEAYPNPVRVVSIGVSSNELLTGDKAANVGFEYSVELCGGTHVKSTSSIQNFVITAEESISKGVRRIVAITGNLAKKATQNLQTLQDYLETLKSTQPPTENYNLLLQQLKSRIDDAKCISHTGKKELLKQITQLNKAASDVNKEKAKSLLKEAAVIGKSLAAKCPPNCAIVAVLPEINGDGKALDSAIQGFQSGSSDSAALLLSSGSNGVAGLAVAWGEKDGVGALSAVEWLSVALCAIGGKAGGSKHRAVGGSKNINADVEEALYAAKTYLKQAGIAIAI